MMYKKALDIICIGAIGIDTNIYLFSNQIDFSVEMNFSENIDYIGQAGGYSSRIATTLSLNTGFIGYVGDDFLGNYIKKMMSEWNIESLWFFDPKGTKRSINLMNKKGERKNFYDGKGSMIVKPDLELIKGFLVRTNLIHVNIVNWSRFILSIAKKLGITISCDIQDVVNPHDPYREDFIRYADILFLSTINITEIDHFLSDIRNINPEVIIIMGMGSKGAGLSLPGNYFRLFTAPHLPFSIIDSNGAGDSLAIGFLYGYKFLKLSIEESLLLGQINARYTCSLKAPKTQFLIKEQLMMLFEEIKVKYFRNILD